MRGKSFQTVATSFLSRSTLAFFRKVLPPLFGRLFYRVFGSAGGVARAYDLQIHVIDRCKTVPNATPRSESTTLHSNFVAERKYPETFVVRLDCGITTSSGYNLTSSGRLVPEASYEALLGFKHPDWRQAVVLDRYEIWRDMSPLPKLLTLDCEVATLSTRFQSNYYHWLFDVLPRIRLLRKAGAKPDVIYVDIRETFQRDSLEMLGISLESVIPVGVSECVTAKRLVVPSIPGVPGTVPAWVCRFLSGEAGRQASDGCGARRKNIFISRAKAARRRLTNEGEVVNMLEKFGFHSVSLEELSFAEQVGIFKGADRVIAPHGAGLSNIVFCRPYTKVVELFHPKYVNLCFWNIAQAAHLDYGYVLGRAENTGAQIAASWAGGGDFVVDVRRLESFLRTWVVA